MKSIFYFTYISTLLALVLFSYAFVDPNLFYFHSIFTNFAFSRRGTTTLLFIVFLCLLFAHFILFPKILKKEKEIITFILITCGILIFAYPAMLSFDIFNYIATAKVAFLYRENPYIIMPVDILNEPMLRFLHAGNKTALYGPVWITITFIPLFLGISNFFLILLMFKLVAILGYFGIIWILWKFNKDIKNVLLFAFNPLVVFELCVSGHNDGIMIFFALTSIYLLKSRKIFWSICLLIGSVGIKFATVFLIPVYIFVLIQILINHPINWKKIFLLFTISMFAIFALSPLREEMYSWYAIWFLPFVYLSNNRILLWISNGLSLGLLFRYIPFMYLGTYFGPTPIIKIVLTVVPVAGSVIIFYLKTRRSKFVD